MYIIDGITYCAEKADKAERAMAWREGRNLFLELLFTLALIAALFAL